MTKSTRRQFLINTSMAILAVPASPGRTLHNMAHQTTECSPTTLDLFGEGPFYTENPPQIKDGLLASLEEIGERLILTGRVYNLDCSAFIPNTLIDVWHASAEGQYDNVGLNLRGTTLSNEQGFYQFETIMPGKYLNGSRFRPSHIHFRITPPGRETLITQLYFEGDEEISSDSAASIEEGEFDARSRIIPTTRNANGKLEGTWDIRISGDGVTSTRNLHLDKGMIYSAGPNPFTDRLIIQYGVFRRSKVTLLVHDILGRQVAMLSEKDLLPEKYEAIWIPEPGLSQGTYFVSLQLNDAQIHYSKVIKRP